MKKKGFKYSNQAMNGYYLVTPSTTKSGEIKAQYLNFIPYKRIYSNLAMSGYYSVTPSPIKRAEIKAQYLNFIPYKRILIHSLTIDPESCRFLSALRKRFEGYFIIKTIASICGENMLGYMSLYIICSS